jgi:transposase-like protein
VYTYFMTDFLPVILNQPSGRKHYTYEFKRQIVEASLVAGTSISGLALKYGINTNLVHKWRARYRHGTYGVVNESATLAATQIVSPARSVAANARHQTNINVNTQSPDCIELFFNRTRVLVHGAPDSQTLRNIIDALRT